MFRDLIPRLSDGNHDDPGFWETDMYQTTAIAGASAVLEQLKRMQSCSTTSW